MRRRDERGVTIQDVARSAGVSSTSISNFLNGRLDEMREETRQRIAQAIKELAYVPSSVARQLKTGKAAMIGLLVPSVVNPYYGELAAAVDAAAQARGYRVILGNTQRDARRELAFVNELVASGVRGIIAAAVLPSAKAMKALLQRGGAFVVFETTGVQPTVGPIDVVSMDSRVAGRLAAEHLIALGHRSLAYVTATPLTPHRQARLDGFRDGLAAHGLGDGLLVTDEDFPALAAAHSDADLARFGHLAAGHLASRRARPSGVVALNDLLAIGLMSGFHAQGIRIPEDVSVVGIDDIQLASFSYPTLTSVRQPYREIAESAVERVCARLSDSSLPGSMTLIEPTLVARDSTAARPA